MLDSRGPFDVENNGDDPETDANSGISCENRASEEPRAEVRGSLVELVAK